MNRHPPSNKSETDWERLDAMPDEDIDLSDCPEVTPEMFAKAVVRHGQSILDNISEEQAYPDLTDSQKQELDPRYNDYEANPDNVLT